MAFSTAAAFWTVSFLLCITPGADWAYILSSGIRNRVAPAVSGLVLGHLTAILVVVAGVGALVASTPGALTALTLGGSAYLLWLGIAVLRDPPVPQAGEADAPGSSRAWLAKGALISGLNPKGFVLFLALLPQFTTATSPLPVPAQLLTLGALHVVTCAIVYSMVGLGSRSLLGARPGAARIVSGLSGVAMILVAGLLVAEQLGHWH